MEDTRPDPDGLLLRVQEQERQATAGRLTIFVGAAPGVGKTWAMLEAAREEAPHRTVLIGVVETHGRRETEALLAGFEILPRREIAYRGIGLREFDLDAALARHPALLLVDEMAHTNAPGSRHPKRWQDIEELLGAGIDVFTTVNVQHLESLNDVVTRMTGVVVRETVPDALFDRADAVRVVDLPPDQLLERMREGKVYLPDQAERAADGFFRKGNLIALRELVLRRMAERVDAQMQEYRREHGVEKVWSMADRILVCVSPSPWSAQLVRAASRMARGLHARWFAVHVETPQTTRLSDADRARLATNLRLAERLGAENVVVHGDRTADALLQFARKHRVTKIIIGKPRETRLRDRLKGSFVDEIIRRSPETIDAARSISLVVMASRPISRVEDTVPPVLAEHLRNWKRLPKHLIFFSVVPVGSPAVVEADRFDVIPFFSDEGGTIVSVQARYGYMEQPHIRRALARLKGEHRLKIPEQPRRWLILIGSERFVTRGRTVAERLRIALFSRMNRLAKPATDYFGLESDTGLTIETINV